MKQTDLFKLDQRPSRSLVKLSIRFFIALAFFVLPLVGSEARTIEIPFERNENGHIIVKLELSSGLKKIETKWLFDTGSELTHLSDTIPEEFYKIGKGVVNVTDAYSSKEKNQTIITINQFIIGTQKINNIEAVKTNLKFSLKYEDEPIDGIIGMNILVNNVVKIDFELRKIYISNVKFQTHGIKLRIVNKKVPICRLKYDNKTIEAICDTGSSGSFEFPNMSGIIVEPGAGVYTAGAFSNSKGSNYKPRSIEWLGRFWFSRRGRWTKANVVISPGILKGTIGMRIWGAVPSVTFDFIKGWVIFSHSGAELPMDKSKGPFIPVYWDRKDPIAPFLVVEEVSHLKPHERLGFESGDIVISIDGNAEGLSRRRFQDASLTPGSQVEVRRKGQVLSLTIPATPATPPAPAPPYPAPLPPNSP
ncbi:MAG: hypothetical protein IPL96_10900 [Holophagaceae bacterium]|nr:hypothetical protein [Holophagaceae bacterium]